MLNKAVLCHKLKNTTDGVRTCVSFIEDNVDDFFNFFAPEMESGKRKIVDIYASQSGIVLRLRNGQMLEYPMGAFAEWAVRMNSPFLLRETLADIKRRNPDKVKDPDEYIAELKTAGLLKWSSRNIRHGDGRSIYSNGCGVTYKERRRIMQQMEKDRGLASSPPSLEVFKQMLPTYGDEKKEASASKQGASQTQHSMVSPNHAAP